MPVTNTRASKEDEVLDKPTLNSGKELGGPWPGCLPQSVETINLGFSAITLKSGLKAALWRVVFGCACCDGSAGQDLTWSERICEECALLIGRKRESH